jgi:acyl-coenzyme A synthetase/AMP-(fatty) acid ligase
MPNSTVFAVAAVAVSALGAVIVPIKHSMLAGEVIAVTERVGAGLFVASASRAEHVAELGDNGLIVVTDQELWGAATRRGPRRRESR